MTKDLRYLIYFVAICFILLLPKKQQVEARHVFKCYNRPKVIRGDNCWDIARKHKLNVKEFMRINHIPRGCRNLQV